MENLILNWRYSENGIQFFAKSDYIEKMFAQYEYNFIKNFKGEYIALYELMKDELEYNDEKFYDYSGKPNLSFLRMVGLSQGVYFEIKNKTTNGIVTKSMIENYIQNVKYQLPKTLRLVSYE